RNNDRIGMQFLKDFNCAAEFFGQRCTCGSMSKTWSIAAPMNVLRQPCDLLRRDAGHDEKPIGRRDGAKSPPIAIPELCRTLRRSSTRHTRPDQRSPKILHAQKPPGVLRSAAAR